MLFEWLGVSGFFCVNYSDEEDASSKRFSYRQFTKLPGVRSKAVSGLRSLALRWFADSTSTWIQDEAAFIVTNLLTEGIGGLL